MQVEIAALAAFQTPNWKFESHINGTSFGSSDSDLPLDGSVRSNCAKFSSVKKWGGRDFGEGVSTWKETATVYFASY